MDYKFNFIVDATAPDVDAKLYFRPYYDAEGNVYYNYKTANLDGRVLDSNLKEWVVEYGTGDNPSEWNEYKRSSEELVPVEQYGNLNTSAINSFSLYDDTYGPTAEWIVGKKFRITAEDYAGNRRTVTTDMLDEVIFIVTCNYVDNNEFKVLETVRSPLASIDLQYRQYKKDEMDRDYFEWIDIPSTYSSTFGTISTDTDLRFELVRIKAIDIYGRQYYSNEMYTCYDLSGDPRGYNSDYVSLEFDIRTIGECGTQDNLFVSPQCNTRYCKWLENFFVFTNLNYILKVALYKLDLAKLANDKPELDPNDLHDIQSLGDEYFEMVQQYSEVKLDKSFKLYTHDLSEDERYYIRGSLSIIDPEDEITRTGTEIRFIYIDRISPTAEIGYPSGTICLLEKDDNGKRYVRIDGKATDDIEVYKYEFSYGIGAEPQKWLSIEDERYEAAVGELAKWNPPSTDDLISLKLKVADAWGNISCATQTFSVDNLAELKTVYTDNLFMSPNGDGVMDDIQIVYEIAEPATIEVTAFKYDASGDLETTPFVTAATGIQHPGGVGMFTWIGKKDGEPVPDGRYKIVVTATDGCGNIAQKSVKVEVDNTPPTLSISSPRQSEIVGAVVEVKGTADDLNFVDYTLEASATTIANNKFHVKDGLLGTWNTSGVMGQSTLKLAATDKAGNRSQVTVIVEVTEITLIKSLKSTPSIISPNGDGKVDTAVVSYEIGDPANVMLYVIDAAGTTVRSYVMPGESGLHDFTMSGMTEGETAPLNDGEYTLMMNASGQTNPSVTQTEKVSLVIDNAAPNVDISKPAENAFLKSDTAITGTINDPHMLGYKIAVSVGDASVSVDEASQSRENYTFSSLRDLADGEYNLEIAAIDQAQNETNKTIAFTVDKTAPVVKLETPEDGEYYGFNGNVTINGSIEETNLNLFSIRYGAGEAPGQWVDLVSGATITALPQQFIWKTGKDDGIADGLYTVSLFGEDKAGNTGEAKARIIIDNTPPTAVITSPVESAYVKSDMDIAGTAFDENIDKYQVELSEGQCGSAYKWGTIAASETSIQSGTLAKQAVPQDGDYCVRLTAFDKTGNTAEALVSVKIDTHPPAAPVLSGTKEGKTNANLTWTANTEPDLAGYNLYRDGQKLNESLISETSYSDQDLAENTYIYTVKAVDWAGWESDPSNEVKIKIDLTPPDAVIRKPRDGSYISGTVDITGTAYSSDDFKQYRLYIGQGQDPASWELVRVSPAPVAYGTLNQWETSGLAEGDYSMKLEAEDTSGNMNTDQVSVTIDNMPPVAPTLISAEPDSSDVALTWKPNTEQDLAGYLLFRNNQIANASGTLSDFAAYIIPETSYLDAGLPDGDFTYFVVAVDKAGNMSPQSNSLNVSIDTHAPSMSIVDPADGYKFEKQISVEGESRDEDIASAQFQYKRTQDSEWINIGNAVTTEPYVTPLDPETENMTYGDYNLRVVAVDKGGRTDSAPSYITVTYVDLTPPAAPDLKAATDGSTVYLTWTWNTEPDVNGYNLYYWIESGQKEKLNSTILTTTDYTIQNVPDGVHYYEVTAIDVYENESAASNTGIANVYAPIIDQPYTPSGENPVLMSGINGGADTQIDVMVDSGSGPISRGTTTVDSNGNFSFNAQLELGENRVTARATDGDGNRSRISEAVVVMYNEPPAQPTGFAAEAEGYNANLTWNANNESDLAGYNLFSDGVKINTSQMVQTGTASSSSNSSSYYSAAKAFDGDSSTSWMSNSYSAESFTNLWWQIDLPAVELINRLEIDWYSQTDYMGNETLYAGKDFQIQGWSGYAWIPLVTVTGNTVKNNILDILPIYRTDKLRIYVTDTTYGNSYQVAGISEVRIFKDVLISETSYSDPDLKDGNYPYTLTAVDYYGFASTPAKTEAVVGDVIPPSAPLNLTATASGSDVTLTWTPSSEEDVIGYAVYRDTPGGWVRLNETSIPETTYIDANLRNDTYTYRVTALDAVGNESLPSNEASATIFIEIPQPPIGLQVSSTSIGGELSLSWQHPDGQADGYNVYRSLSSGAGYVKINNDVVAGTTYLDTGLANDTAYYYVVVAVDQAGNESVHSNEAMGVPADTVLPTPSIFLPTTPGAPITISNDTSDLHGNADPGSLVRLYHNGSYTGMTTSASEEGALRAHQIEDQGVNYDYFSAEGGRSLSPDGKTLAYTDTSSYLQLEDLATGERKMVVENGWNPVWSLDSQSIVYTAGNGLNIYGVSSGNTTQLTTDYTESPSLSSDGAKIAYLSYDQGMNIMIHDLSDGTVSQITNDSNAWSPKLSPDGKKVAYIQNYQTLVIVDLDTNTVTQVDNEVYDYSIRWSADSNKIAFISYGSTWNEEITVYDLQTGSKNTVADSAIDITAYTWSPDSKNILFTTLEDYWWSETSSVWITEISDPGSVRLIQENVYGLSYLTWTLSGEIGYIAQNDLNLIQLGGYFSFVKAGLDQGANEFYVTAEDSAGNTSSPSDEIIINYGSNSQPDGLPDISVSTDDIYMYPPSPIAGDQVSLTANIRNNSQVDASNVEVLVYLWNSADELELLKTETITVIPANGSVFVTSVWDSTGKTGDNMLIVVADPYDSISEADESNNMAIKNFFVTETEGVAMTTSTDSSQYNSNETVTIDVTPLNSGPAKDAVLEVQIEDENGYPVTAFDQKSLTLPYASNEVHQFLWETGSTYAGSYFVHSLLLDGAETLAENKVAFTILPDVIVGLDAATDKAAYGPNENVNIAFTVSNDGSNYIIPSLDITVKITDAAGNVMFADSKSISNLLPGTKSSMTSAWNTGLANPGSYQARIQAFVEGNEVSTKTVDFRIDGRVSLAGTINVTPSVVGIGNSAQIAYTVSNSGNLDAVGYTIRISVIDPATQDVMNSYDELVDIAMNSSKSSQVVFDTENCGLKKYSAVLQVIYQGATSNIANASFTVKDLLPPTVGIISPEEGATYNSTVEMIVTVSDDASGVDSVEYQMDNGEWHQMAVSDASTGRYSIAWEPALTDNGSHSVNFRATDKAGNISSPVTVNFIVQLDAVPPVTTIAVGTPMYEANGTLFVSADTIFTMSASDNFSGVATTEYRLDNGQWTAYAPFVISAEGAHTIYYRSLDNAGNLEEFKTLAVTVDATPPQTTVSASDELIDGVVNTVSPLTFFTLNAADSMSGVRSVAYRIDDGEWQGYTGSFNLAGMSAGQYTIAFKATDNVLNQEVEQTISVRLIVLGVEKKIAADAVVLVGIEHDNSDYEQKQADLEKLRTVLTSLGLTFTIAETRDDFASAFRSGRYNTYILLDVKEPVGIGEEIREAVYSGDGLIFIKTNPKEDTYLDDVFGVTFPGKTTEADLVVDLASSPISAGGALQTLGKSVVSTVSAETVQLFGSVTDKHVVYPSIIFNQYEKGKVLLYTFDLLSAPDESPVSALLIESINYVRPEAMAPGTLSDVPVSITVANTGQSAEVRVNETFPTGMTVDSIVPNVVTENNTIAWQKSLAVDEKARFGYTLNLPDTAGNYVTTTELLYGNNGFFRPYGQYELMLTVQNSSGELLQTVVAQLQSLVVNTAEDAKIIAKATDCLQKVDADASSRNGAKNNITLILEAINQVRSLTADGSAIRSGLDGLLRVWEKKWTMME